MTQDDSSTPPPRFFFPEGSMVGGPASTSNNLPKCPNCGSVMFVIEQVAAHCLECCYKQKYPWKIRSK